MGDVEKLKLLRAEKLSTSIIDENEDTTSIHLKIKHCVLIYKFSGRVYLLEGQVHYFLAKLGVGFISVDIYVGRYKGELSFSGEAHQLRPSLLHPLLLLLY